MKRSPGSVKPEPCAFDFMATSSTSGSSVDDEDDTEGDNGMHWMEAIKRLQACHVNPRPSHIADEDSQAQQVFLEHPLLKRRKGDDRWMTSGGRKGALERWATPEVGVIKRYGRVVRGQKVPLKYAQYSLQVRRYGCDGKWETIDIKDKSLWVVQPLHDTITAQNVLSAPNAGPRQATVDIHAPTNGKLLSFQSAVPSEGGIELGAVVRQGFGVKMQSGQGDFAEWHRRASGEDPFEEGDVVGFRRGCITRNTHGCSALGVVSRKAVVEGTTPPEAERHLFDTVAYCGVVPVKLSTQRAVADLGCGCPALSAGQLLVPSGRCNGTAVLVPANESISRVGILLEDPESLELDHSNDLTSPQDYKLVTALVVAPAVTVRSGVRRMHWLRRLAMLIVWLVATTTVAVYLFCKMTPLAPGREQASDYYSVDELSKTCPIEVQRCLDTEGCQELLDEARVNRGGLVHYGIGNKNIQHIVTCMTRSCSSELPEDYVKLFGCPTNVCDVNHLWSNMPPGYLTQVDWTPEEEVSAPETSVFLTLQQLGLRCDVGYTYDDANFGGERWRPPVAAACLQDRGIFTNFSGCVKLPSPATTTSPFTTSLSDLRAKCPMEVEHCYATDGCPPLLDIARRNAAGLAGYGWGASPRPTVEVMDVVNCYAKAFLV